MRKVSIAAKRVFFSGELVCLGVVDFPQDHVMMKKTDACGKVHNAV